MKVNKKHLGYAAVVAVGGGWLLMDLVAGPPAVVDDPSAIAIAVDGPSAPASLAEAAPGRRKFSENGDEAEMAARLAAAAQQRGLDAARSGDAFALPAAFRPVEEANAAPVMEKLSAPSQAEVFGRRHKLVSVFVGRSGSAGGAAQVDGRLLKVGDEIEGFKLTAVTQKAATFEGADGLVELSFDEAITAQTATAALPTN